MGAKILGIVTLATLGAILGDMLVHVPGTNAIFSGVGNLVGSTYKAAGGGFSTA